MDDSFVPVCKSAEEISTKNLPAFTLGGAVNCELESEF